VRRQKKNRSTESEMPHDDTRSRILAAATKLLSESGRDALTTRSVAEAAGVQPPVLYRQFKDKEAMLDALAEHGFLAYMAEKRRSAPESDPVDVLRSGWDLHVEFGLTQPALYLLMYAQPKSNATLPAGQRSLSMLRHHVGRIAAAGRLRVPEERAVSLFHAAAVGTVLVLLSAPADARDMAISHMARDAALALIVDAPLSPTKRPERTAAITLRAALDQDAPFSSGELLLLKEWLDRLAKAS
jgi:AcrR family transcriptional regulator